MKLGRFSVGLAVAILLFAMTPGCGKTKKVDGPPADQQSNGVPPDGPDSAEFTGVTPVNGGGMIGSQCQLGYYNDPVPTKEIQAVDCFNADLKKAELTQTLKPLILEADCRKGYITIRGERSSHEDGNWEIKTDKSFDITIDGGKTKLKTDGYGSSDCVMPLAANLYGKIDCSNPENAIIDLHIRWNFGKVDPNTLDPVPYVPEPGEVVCALPKTCYLYADKKIKQCP